MQDASAPPPLGSSPPAPGGAKRQLRRWLVVAALLIIAPLLIHLIQNLLAYRALRRIEARGGLVESLSPSPLMGWRVPRRYQDSYVLRTGYIVSFGDPKHAEYAHPVDGSLVHGTFPMRDGGNAGVAAAADLPNVTALYLVETSVDDRGLRHLDAMRALTDLDLTRTRVTGSGLAHLAPDTPLETLSLAHTPLDGAALVHIGRLAHLDFLNLSHTCFDGEHLAELIHLRQLRYLSLRNTCIRSHHLRHLRDSGVVDLDINGTPLDDAAIAHLEAMPALNVLIAWDTPISDAAARRSKSPAVRRLLEHRRDWRAFDAAVPPPPSPPPSP